ncbi:hypothetical protein niasHT_011617 [Heterodera trifolii]|uniref:BTB domain-containing protein n=1 Tax=Heterodera trifolii TaxID=157864 RepID=A0ABD2LGY4_9BILA
MRITEMERIQTMSSHGGYDTGHQMSMAKPDTLADRMKLLLSTAKSADAHFLLMHAHKTILIAASNVFEAMFQTDKENSNGTNTGNASSNCPAVVEIPDIEPSAFKVMLSFIYTDDLSELNGDNTMAVLYATKKYNVPGLMRPSLQIPISEFRNIFLAYDQALIFELEDFSNKCLRYICQNAAQLFGSHQFLQIDQKMLCVLLDSDRLLLSDEFEIWKIALRWADEKCRQNGIECSSGNRRSVLGPALFKIRFPNIHEDDFAKCVVPSSVLTLEECSEFISSIPIRIFIVVWSPRAVLVEIPQPWTNFCKMNCRGYVNFISFAELLNPSEDLYNQNEDKATLAIDVIVK